jgi:hypothetical protein
MNRIVELTFDGNGKATIVVEAGKKWKSRGKNFMFFTVPATRLSIKEVDKTRLTGRRLRSGEVIIADDGSKVPLFDPRIKQIKIESEEAMLALAKMAADAFTGSGMIDKITDPLLRGMARWYGNMDPKEWEVCKNALLGKTMPPTTPASSGPRLVYATGPRA